MDALGLRRCPYCHEDCGEDAVAVCRNCLARHHAPCWDELGACASCSQTRVLREAPPPPPPLEEFVASEPVWLRVLVAGVLALTTVAAVALFGYVLYRAQVLVQTEPLLEVLFFVSFFAVLLGIPTALAANSVRVRVQSLRAPTPEPPDDVDLDPKRRRRAEPTR